MSSPRAERTRSLRRIFRSDEFRFLDEPVVAPDISFGVAEEEPEPEPDAVPEPAEITPIPEEPSEPAFDPAAMEAELRRQLTEELTASIRAELDEELRLAEETQRAACAEAHRKAQEEAEAIRAAAREEAAALVEAARGEADGIRQTAHDEGYADGVAQKMDDVTKCIADIGAEIEQIKQDQLGFQEDYARELRELALEISEKLLCTKLDADDSLLLGLVRRAVKPIREAGWIKIDVSDKIGDYAAVLEKMIAQTRPSQKIEVEMRRDAHKGTCVIQTADGVVVASVLTQLANIRSYLEEFETECEETDETERREAVAGAPAS